MYIINENAEGYVDLSTSEEFELESTTGCITVIGTGKSKRLRLGKEIFEALGSPEVVGMKFMPIICLSLVSRGSASSS